MQEINFKNISSSLTYGYVRSDNIRLNIRMTCKEGTVTDLDLNYGKDVSAIDSLIDLKGEIDRILGRLAGYHIEDLAKANENEE